MQVAAERGLGGARTFEKPGGSPISTPQWASGSGSHSMARDLSVTQSASALVKRVEIPQLCGAALRTAALGDHAPVSVGRRRLWMGEVGYMAAATAGVPAKGRGQARAPAKDRSEQGTPNALRSRGKGFSLAVSAA
jgi:hypothetical protein